MSDLSWLSVDARTGVVLADLPDLDVSQVARSLGQYESTTATLPVPTAPEGWEQATLPGGAVMVLLSDGRPIWGGMVTQRQRGGDTVSMSLATVESYLDRRFVTDVTYAATGQNEIVADLIARFVADGAKRGLPIRVQYTGAGTVRTRTYLDADDKSVYSILTELASVEGGPEWTIEWEHLTSPERYCPVLYVGARIGSPVLAGMSPAATFEQPGPVTDATYVEDYSAGKGANNVIAVSTAVADVRPQSPAQTSGNDGRPTFEHRYTPSTSITSVSTLTTHAARALSSLAPGAAAITLSAVVSDAPQLGVDWSLGDDVGYVLGGLDTDGVDTVPAFPGGLSGVARCFGWTLDLGVTPVVTPILAGLVAQQVAPPLNIVFDGDSITKGSGASTVPGGYAFETTNNLSSDTTTYNVGVGSETLATMLTNAPTVVDPKLNSARQNVCSIFGGTNDFYFSSVLTAADLYADLVAYHRARRVAGFKTIAYTMMPRSAGATPGNFESRRQTFNALVVAGWAGFADALVDIGNDPIMGAVGAELDTTYFADLVHPTDAGHARISGLVLLAVASLRVRLGS